MASQAPALISKRRETNTVSIVKIKAFVNFSLCFHSVEALTFKLCHILSFTNMTLVLEAFILHENTAEEWREWVFSSFQFRHLSSTTWARPSPEQQQGIRRGCSLTKIIPLGARRLSNSSHGFYDSSSTSGLTQTQEFVPGGNADLPQTHWLLLITKRQI